MCRLLYSECVNRWHADEKLRKNMQEHGNTIEDMQKWDTPCKSWRKAQREHVAHKWQWPQNTLRCTHTTTSTSARVQPRSPMETKSTEPPKSADAHSRERSRARTPPRTSQWLSSSSSTLSQTWQWAMRSLDRPTLKDQRSAAAPDGRKNRIPSSTVISKEGEHFSDSLAASGIIDALNLSFRSARGTKTRNR